MGARFAVLGPVEVVVGSSDLTPTAPKLLQLLAMVVLRAGKQVQTDAIVEELWPGAPPQSARTTVQTYVYQLRRIFESGGLADRGEDVLVTKATGYMLRVDPEQIDMFVFQRLCQEGREALRRHRYAETADLFRSGLSLWSGPPLENVKCGARLAAFSVDLKEQRRYARYLRIEAEIEVGMYRELVGELRSLIATDPLDEELHGQLIRVLDRSGRRSDALDAYRNLRITLNEELGLDPCADVQQLHHDLLSADRLVS
ncbi:AfsR/SARP family transcriptional regulator [Amycolatopsis cihanbeyliensis]|uniref:AfsR/SARP family transcriptional regulator n=1 Tax=Amycolatopsis cihanbeyliensis TaxID=1128664 RepID=UPI001FE70851|nr:AfsR/SARP family transcriptional regulator [Amycolatopsis cihanbeyliensis]